jgi:O-antigen/teichoic acid export membrane protein
VPSQTQKIAFDTAALFVGKVLGLLLGIIRLNYLARFLGVAGFGVLNFALYFTSLFQVFFDFGISQLLTRELARDPNRSKELVGTVVLLKVVMVFIASIVPVAAAIISDFDHIVTVAIVFTSAAFSVNGIAAVFLSAFQAHRRMVLVSAANLINDLLTSIIIILIIRDFPSVTTALIVTLAVAAFNVLLLFLFYVQVIGMPLFRADVSVWRSLLMESSPLAVGSLAISIYMFVGPSVLKYTRGDADVGVYSAAHKLTSILTLIPVAFTQVVYPIFSNFFAATPEKLTKALSDSLRVMLQISLPLAVSMFFLADDIIRFLYPPSFAEATLLLKVLALGIAFGYLAWVFYAFLISVNRQRFCMVSSVAVAVIVVLASFIAIPKAGMLATAIIVASTETVLFVSFYTYFIRMGYKLPEKKRSIKVIIAALLMGLTLLGLMKYHPLLALGVGFMVYVVALMSLKAFGDQERELMGKILGRNSHA